MAVTGDLKSAIPVALARLTDTAPGAPGAGSPLRGTSPALSRPGAARPRLRWSLLLGAAALTLGGFNAPIRAETLREALVSAYVFNPQLKAQRAALRATDENVARAKSGYRPTISGQADHLVEDQKISPDWQNISGVAYPRSYSIGLTQPIFRGFRTINAVRGAEADVEAGREDLRAVEQDVLLSASQAYLDVVRDLTVVSLQENNVRVLAEQLKATRNRFQVGEVTRTDVAQSEARLSGGQSQLSVSRATLQVSRANYERIIGHAPGRLAPPDGVDRALPTSLDGALHVGLAENPTIIATLYRERAQDHAINEARGELLPQINLQANYVANYNPQHGTSELLTGTFLGRITVPLYQAGEVGARIRQNVELRSQLRQMIDQARQQVQANITSAWSQVVSIRTQITANQAQVSANTIALSGVREEEKVGQRTVLDVLNAQLELLNSQVELERSKRNLGVASYSLLASIGHLGAGDLALNTPLYDPSRHYHAVKDKVSDWDWSTHADETTQTDWTARTEPADESEVGPLGVPADTKHRASGPAYQQ